MLVTALIVLAATKPSQALPTVEELVGKMRSTLAQAKGLSMRIEIKSPLSHSNFTAIAQRPNYYRVESEKQCFYSDGGLVQQYFPELKTYNHVPAAHFGRGIPVTGAFALYNPPATYKPPFDRVVSEEFEGKTALGLETAIKQIPGMVVTLYVDPSTYLPLGEKQKDHESVSTTVIHDLKTDRVFKPEDFAWTPPPGVTDLDALPAKAPWLPNGTVAPAFTFNSAKGNSDLSSMLKGKKGILVNFWFYGCGGCMVEMPELDKLYKKMKKQGFEMIALNPVDDLTVTSRYIKESKFSFPAGVAAESVAIDYKAKGSGYPTNYVLDSEGKVVYASTGYSPANMRAIVAALKGLGFKE